jgi:hypothetical protein
MAIPPRRPIPTPTPFSAPINAGSADNNVPGVAGTSGQLLGQFVDFGGGIGVYGSSGTGDGVFGSSEKNGVHGWSPSPTDSGVWGENTGKGYGVSGSTNSDFVAGSGITAGVWGNNAGSGTGVKGTSQGGYGVLGFSNSSVFAGVSGINNSGTAAGNGGPGVFGSSSNKDGVVGFSQSSANAGVSGTNTTGGLGVWASSPTGIAIYGQGKVAGHFQGDVEVTGTLNVAVDIVMPASDFAEDFTVEASESVEPGTVMVLDENGLLRPCDESYDRKVVGVVSGAGDYRPGLILDRQKSTEGRLPLALVGKVYCKVDATYGSVEVGDLLTSSATPGHGMKASDPGRAFGAVIGKALQPLKSGQALVAILVSLQ